MINDAYRYTNILSTSDGWLSNHIMLSGMCKSITENSEGYKHPKTTIFEKEHRGKERGKENQKGKED